MEPKTAKARPPALIDRAVRSLIPPASREAVVGDLWERYASPLRYAAEALRIVPFLIASQIRRNTSVPLLGIAAFTLFVSFGGFQVVGGPVDVPRWARAAVPAIAAILGLLLRDAYRGSGQQRARRAAFDIVTVVACVLLCETALAGLSASAGFSPDWILAFPLRRVLITTLGVAMLFSLRMAADYRLPCKTGEISADDLVREFQQFERGVRWRRRREIIGAFMGLAVGSAFFLRATALSLQISWAVSIALTLFLVWFLASKTSVKPMPGETTFASSLAYYRGELERQRRLLRTVAWWWLLPMLPALVGEVIAGGAANTPVQVGGYLVICFLVGWLYAQSARKLQQRSDSLAALAERR
jgi:hypothetical protein